VIINEAGVQLIIYHNASLHDHSLNVDDHPVKGRSAPRDFLYIHHGGI